MATDPIRYFSNTEWAQLLREAEDLDHQYAEAARFDDERYQKPPEGWEDEYDYQDRNR